MMSEGNKGVALAALTGLVIVAALGSAVVGSARIGGADVVQALFAFDGSREHLVVWTLRLPRVLAGLLCGGALAVAGAIMQAVTANPLASPGLFGINAGAAFAVVIAISLLGIGSSSVLVWFAFAGAGAAAVVTYAAAALGPRSGVTTRLVLAGAVLTTFLTSLTTAILIFDQTTLDAVRLWTAGSLAGRTMDQVRAVSPYMIAGLVGALLLGRHLMTLSLGATAARSVGQHPLAWRSVAVVLVILLAGGAVALAGPISLVGLVVPHMVRMTIGFDYRWIIPFCAAGGALLVLAGDTMGRLLFSNQSFPVGVTMALIGAPFFIALAHGRLGSLR